jgi:site-specific DNA-methyltransferase (adenine-specific)|tara:strand:- start:680 stop:1243 length:564 start_codon:yes stop_codon:yes gene_type:complete
LVHEPLLPNKKYNIIYADPPWSFSSKELQKYNGVRFTSMDKHYPTQSKHWIKNLPIKKITNNDCALFLWSTDAHIKEAIETMEAWGFKYITIVFVWEKKTKTGKTVANLGAWTMKNYEICLLGTKGAMLKHKKVNNIYQKVEAVRTKHSKKPQKVRENIEKLFGDLPRIELFARQRVEGWDCWGNEV